MGERGAVMRRSPGKSAAALVAIFLPPACREEVLGDLHERYRGPLQYGLDALRTLPWVIASRMRRTADPEALLMQAFVAYLSFLGAAWLSDGMFPHDRWVLLRLAVPVGALLLGSMIEDAYANPGQRSPMQLARGPLLGLGLAFLFQGTFWAGSPNLAVPFWTMLYGGAMSLLLASAVRVLFPAARDQRPGGQGMA